MANEEDKRYLSKENAKYLWDKLVQRFDKKLDSVTNKDNSIDVDEGRKIGVRVSNANDNVLQVNNDGLHAPKNHKLVFGAGQQYEYDGSQDIVVPVYTGDVNHN